MAIRRARAKIRRTNERKPEAKPSSDCKQRKQQTSVMWMCVRRNIPVREQKRHSTVDKPYGNEEKSAPRHREETSIFARHVIGLTR